jgi:hypothetical protein
MHSTGSTPKEVITNIAHLCQLQRFRSPHQPQNRCQRSHIHQWCWQSPQTHCRRKPSLQSRQSRRQRRLLLACHLLWLLPAHLLPWALQVWKPPATCLRWTAQQLLLLLPPLLLLLELPGMKPVLPVMMLVLLVWLLLVLAMLLLAACCPQLPAGKPCNRARRLNLRRGQHAAKSDAMTGKQVEHNSRLAGHTVEKDTQ